MVHADGDMAIAFFQEPFQLAFDADAAHGDTLGRPRIAIIGRHYLSCAQHIVVVVHRLSLSHEYDVGEFIALR